MRSRSAELAAALVVALALPGVAHAAPGDLDPSFGSGGMARTVSGYAGRVAALSDGSVIVTSYSDSVFRMTADGRRDSSFGATGSGSTQFDFGGLGEIGSLLVAPGDRIVLAGTTRLSGTADVAVARLLPDGTFDPSFGAGGKVTVDLGRREHVAGAAVGPDGSIVLVGDSSTDSERHSFVARLEPDGDLDPTFSADGYEVDPIEPAAGQSGGAVALAPGGSILAEIAVAEGSDAYPAHPRIVRFEPDGDPDPAFSGDGVAPLDLPTGTTAVGLHRSPSGGVYFVGSTNPNGAGQVIAKLDEAGGPDPAFSGDGYEQADFFVRGSTVDSAGRLILAGTSANLGPLRRTDVEVMRLAASGAPDPAFSGDGRVTTDVSGRGQDDFGRDVTLDPAGRIVVTATGSFPDSLVLRYLADEGPADADADGIRDDADPCPFRAGPGKYGGCPRYPTGLTLEYAKHVDDFEGTVDFGRTVGCSQRARVIVYRVRPRNDQRVGVWKAPPLGEGSPYGGEVKRPWEVSALARPGRYYAVLERQRVEDVGICTGARTEKLRIGAR